jgi:hypothetical protein
MDLFDERILAVLNDGKSRVFAQLLGEVGFSRNTLKRSIDRLDDKNAAADQHDCKPQTVPHCSTFGLLVTRLALCHGGPASSCISRHNDVHVHGRWELSGNQL